MNYYRTLEFYEALYLFTQIRKLSEPLDKTLKRVEIEMGSNIKKALLKVLVTSGYLRRDQELYVYAPLAEALEQQTLESTNYKIQLSHLQHLYLCAVDIQYNFFGDLSHLESEIYALHNFEVTYKVGQLAAQFLDLSCANILEIGGNSGGFANGVTQMHSQATYTIVDSSIPCRIGRMHQKQSSHQLNFIEGDVFDLSLSLPKQQFDYLILMNFLHDYNDENVHTIISHLSVYTHKETKIVVIEDILSAYNEPKEVVMQGLRLAIACKGATQRTKEEMSTCFASSNYSLERSHRLNTFQTMLIYSLPS